MKTDQPILPPFRHRWATAMQWMALFSVFQEKPGAAQTTDTDRDRMTNLWKYACRTPPASGVRTLAKWTYKAIFRVGQWSDEMSLTVGG